MVTQTHTRVQVGHVLIIYVLITGFWDYTNVKKKNITSTVPGASKIRNPNPKKNTKQVRHGQELKPRKSIKQPIHLCIFVWGNLEPTNPTTKKTSPPTKTELRIDPQGCRVTLKLHPFIWKMVRVTDPDITLEAITLQALQKLHLSESPFWKNTRFLHTQLEAFTQLWLKFLEHLISFQLLPGVWKKSHDGSISLWQCGIIYPKKSYIDPIKINENVGEHGLYIDSMAYGNMSNLVFFEFNFCGIFCKVR